MEIHLAAIGSQNYIHFECATWMIRKEGNMHDDKKIPKFDSYEEMAAFWDTHSLADYWEQTEPVDFDFAPEALRQYLAGVDREVLARVQRLARTREGNR